MTEEKSIENSVNQALDESVENLSPEIRRRLNQARISATESRSASVPFFKLAMGVSFAVFFGVIFSVYQPETPLPSEAFAQVIQDEVPEEDLDLLEDLEFVYWMAEESDSALL